MNLLPNTRYNRFLFGLPQFVHNTLDLIIEMRLVKVTDATTQEILGFKWQPSSYF